MIALKVRKQVLTFSLGKHSFTIVKVSVQSRKGTRSPLGKSVCKCSRPKCGDRRGCGWSFFEEDFLAHSSQGSPDRWAERPCSSQSFLPPPLLAPEEPALVPVRRKDTPL